MWTDDFDSRTTDGVFDFRTDDGEVQLATGTTIVGAETYTRNSGFERMLEADPIQLNTHDRDATTTVRPGPRQRLWEMFSPVDRLQGGILAEPARDVMGERNSDTWVTVPGESWNAAPLQQNTEFNNLVVTQQPILTATFLGPSYPGRTAWIGQDFQRPQNFPECDCDGSENIKLPTFKGEYVEAFLTLVDEAAKHFQWSQATKRLQFLTHLDRKIQTMFLSCHSDTSVEEMMSMLRTRYAQNLSVPQVYNELRRMIRKPGEDLYSLSERIQDMSRRAEMPEMKQRQLARDTFFTALQPNSELQHWVNKYDDVTVPNMLRTLELALQWERAHGTISETQPKANHERKKRIAMLTSTPITTDYTTTTEFTPTTECTSDITNTETTRCNTSDTFFSRDSSPEASNSPQSSCDSTSESRTSSEDRKSVPKNRKQSRKRNKIKESTREEDRSANKTETDQTTVPALQQ